MQLQDKNILLTDTDDYIDSSYKEPYYFHIILFSLKTYYKYCTMYNWLINFHIYAVQ